MARSYAKSGHLRSFATCNSLGMSQDTNDLDFGFILNYQNNHITLTQEGKPKGNHFLGFFLQGKYPSATYYFSNETIFRKQTLMFNFPKFWCHYTIIIHIFLGGLLGKYSPSVHWQTYLPTGEF